MRTICAQSWRPRLVPRALPAPITTGAGHSLAPGLATATATSRPLRVGGTAEGGLPAGLGQAEACLFARTGAASGPPGPGPCCGLLCGPCVWPGAKEAPLVMSLEWRTEGVLSGPVAVTAGSLGRWGPWGLWAWGAVHELAQAQTQR